MSTRIVFADGLEITLPQCEESVVLAIRRAGGRMSKMSTRPAKDPTNPRAKSRRHGKVTADRWNQ